MKYFKISIIFPGIYKNFKPYNMKVNYELQNKTKIGQVYAVVYYEINKYMPKSENKNRVKIESYQNRVFLVGVSSKVHSLKC